MPCNVCSYAEYFFCHERISPQSLRNHEGGTATDFTALVYFPASDPRRASDLLWPIESSINDAVQVQKQASGSHAEVFSWNTASRRGLGQLP